MFYVGSRQYRTLDDELFVDGKKVHEVTVDGVRVYPDVVWSHHAEWNNPYWLRLSGALDVSIPTKQEQDSGKIYSSIPSHYHITGRVSAVFNTLYAVPVIKGCSISKYDILARGAYNLFADYDSMEDVPAIGILPYEYGLAANCCEFAIKTTTDFPIDSTEIIKDYSTRTRIYDKRLAQPFYFTCSSDDFASRKGGRLTIDTVISPSPHDANSISAYFALAQERPYDLGYGEIDNSNPYWLSNWYGSASGRLMCGVGPLLTIYDNYILRHDERPYVYIIEEVFEKPDHWLSSSLNVRHGLCTFNTVEYANYDVDMATELYLTTGDVGYAMSDIPTTIAPDSEKYARL